MLNAPMKFDDLFKTANFALRIIGIHPECTRDRNWKIKFILLTLYKIYCIIVLCYSILRELKDRRYADACKNAVMLLITVTMMFEYSILLIHQQSIMGIINTINKDYELIRELTGKEKKIVVNYSKNGLTICRIWYIGAITCSIMFPLKAMLFMAYIYYDKGEFELVPMFDLTYPDSIDVHKNEPRMFVMFNSIYLLFAFYGTVTFMGFDPLVPIFLLHACGQLDVARQRISSLYFETSDEGQVEDKLRSIIVKLQEIYRYNNNIKI